MAKRDVAVLGRVGSRKEPVPARPVPVPERVRHDDEDPLWCSGCAELEGRR